MATQDDLKRMAGEKAVEFVPENEYIGIGTGSTVNYFIKALAASGKQIKGAVSSSKATSALLEQYEIPEVTLSDVIRLAVYIDGADEINHSLQMIKGGGGAHLNEKIVASASDKFVCIADESKYVSRLGKFPLPVEVIPMARSFVARELVKLGGEPRWRENVVTDNGNWILDVHHLEIAEPYKLEEAINNIPGVVTNGIFARQAADVVITAYQSGRIGTS